jgi:hypothetical protein
MDKDYGKKEILRMILSLHNTTELLPETCTRMAMDRIGSTDLLLFHASANHVFEFIHEKYYVVVVFQQQQQQHSRLHTVSRNKHYKRPTIIPRSSYCCYTSVQQSSIQSSRNIIECTMFFDAAAATSLVSTLALFVSTTTAFLPQNNELSAARAAFRPPSFTALNSDNTNSAAGVGAEMPAVNRRADKNLMVPRAVKQEKYVALLEWLESSGATINDCLEIRQSSQGVQAGYGVFVDRPVKEGELLFSIPRNLCVTIEKATTSTDDDGTFGNGLQNLIDKAGQGGCTVAMAGYMAKQYILMYLEQRDEEIAAGDDDKDNKNIWGPYLQLLPWKRGINNQEHVLFWNEAKIETLLRGSLCYSEAKSLRSEVALSIQVLGPLLKRSVRMARGDLSTNAFERLTSLLPWEQYKQKNNSDLDDVLDDQLIGDAIKGAFVTLLTRSFEDNIVGDSDVSENKSNDDIVDNENDGDDDDIDDISYEKLVPMLDLLQHSDTPNVRHCYVSSDATVEVRARVDIDPGSELWNQYRSEEDETMPYSRFFTR